MAPRLDRHNLYKYSDAAEKMLYICFLECLKIRSGSRDIKF